TQLISSQLIEVRKARSSGNDEQALSLLMELLRKQKDWKFNAGGSAVFTQEEEMGFATKTVNRKIEAAISRGNALEGRALLAKYSPMYSGNRASTSARFEDRLQKLGAQHCQSMMKGDLQKAPYFGEFLVKY